MLPSVPLALSKLWMMSSRLTGGQNGGLFRQNGVAVLVEAVLLQVLQVLAQRLAGDGHHVQMQHGLDLLHHARHAACVIEVLRGQSPEGRMFSR